MILVHMVQDNHMSLIMQFIIVVLLMKENILKYAIYMKPEFKIEDLDIVDNNVVTKSDGKKILTLQEVSNQAIYEKDGSNEHIHVEKTKETRTNMFASGCCFVDIDVDLKFGKIKIMI